MASCKTYDIRQWMSCLPESLLHLPLSELAIPGSHDSFTFELDAHSEIGPDVADIIRALGPMARGILYKWSVTQHLSWQQQLAAGIRYFDLRVASRKGKSDIYFLHALYGSIVRKGLEEVNVFLNEHPKEIVILDFNHFYGMSDEQHQGLIDMICEVFGSKLCLHLGLDCLTLSTLWENGLQVVVIYHHQTAESNSYVWPASCIDSPWPNTCSIPKAIAFLDTHHNNRRPQQFLVCQGVLTPSTELILKRMFGSLKEDLATKMTPEVVSWLSGRQRGPCGINIVMADFVECIPDFVHKIVDMNFSVIK